MSQGPLCPNLSQKVHAEVSQMANHNLSRVILLDGLSVNLNHLKTKSEAAREEQFNKLFKIAQQEDHPVELVLGGIAKQIIRTLDSDEQDELLDEIQGVSSRFFRQKRQRLRAAKNTSSTTVNADLPPPPPLTAAGQGQNGLQVAQVNEVGTGDILFDVSDMPHLQQYSIEYVRSEEGATYMKI